MFRTLALKWDRNRSKAMYKMVKDVADALNLKVEKKDVELLEVLDHELDESLMHQHILVRLCINVVFCNHAIFRSFLKKKQTLLDIFFADPFLKKKLKLI